MGETRVHGHSGDGGGGVGGLVGGWRPTQVVAGGHRLPDGDGRGSDRDDEHLVVACKKKEKKNKQRHKHGAHRLGGGATGGLLGYRGAGCGW